MTASELSAAFFLQTAVVLVVCRVVGFLGRRLGQPQVVGEMVAGVLLGPSLFGLLLPDLHRAIFPAESLKVLFVTAQLGVGLYMFLVGVEFRSDLFRRRARSAAAISISGMVVPFALGAVMALFLVGQPGFFSERATPLEAALFLGAAMAITAFPTLARIIHERGMTGTPLGTLALAAGSIDDAAAWCVLAVVLASFGGGSHVAVHALVGGIAYTALVLTVGRRALAPLGRAAERAGGLPPPLLAAVLASLMAAAWLTDAIGIHAVFGGFVLGVAMPRGLLARELSRQLEPFAAVFLLPMFFAYSGLNTRLDLVRDARTLAIAVVALVAACVGKGVACWAAARWSGESPRVALAIGALMNARGLMELLLLNIGLQHALIGSGLFTVMVLMAVVTTLLASPLFEWSYGRHARRSGDLGTLAGDHEDPKAPPVPKGLLSPRR